MRRLVSVAIVVGLALATAAAGSSAADIPLSTPTQMQWPVSLDTDLLADIGKGAPADPVVGALDDDESDNEIDDADANVDKEQNDVEENDEEVDVEVAYGEDVEAEDTGDYNEDTAAAAGDSNGTAAGQNGTASANYGPAQGCIPPTLPDPQPLGVRIPRMAAAAADGGSRPNFIVILTDDQGWDDISLNHPRAPGSKPDFIKTPNMDRFLQRSTRFDNFYVAPMCSQSRAALLTGRDFARTGTMLVNGGYDYMNRGEKTAGHIMAADGYKTAHFGKWHNGRTLGYEPWHFGFEDSWFPELYINLDNMMRHNGEYVQTEGLMEQDLMDKMLGWLSQQQQQQQGGNSSQPFFLYYAPNAIHQGWMRPGQGPKWQRPAPEPYLQKYMHLLEHNVSISTIEVWAMLEYMDDVLGRLFDFIEASPLRDNTYVMIMGDNGSELFDGERITEGNLEKRMPSGMQGYKRSVEEGGIRNFLAVQGPGVQGGVVDSTLLDITDVVPTVADLAGVPEAAGGHLPFSGKSFANLLLAGGKAAGKARRGSALASQEQQDRFLFSMSPMCWDPDSVPELDADRKVIKPQPLLDFDTGGVNNALYSYIHNDTANATLGFERCIGVRYKEYKWIGRTGKVYRLPGDSHIELPCNEVTGAQGEALADLMAGAARRWWADLVAEPHSFQKPTFFLGFEGWNVTNVLPDAAHDRTQDRVRLLPNGATGFSEVGDYMCFGTEVVAAGRYEVVLMYTSRALASFELAVGPLADIQQGSAPAITAQLPAMSIMNGQIMGVLDLPSSGGQLVDTCLTLVNNSAPGTPVFLNLGDIRITRLPPADTPAAAAAAADVVVVPRSSGGSCR
ncbi:hypothetical protein OEZ85_012998 [Tetradesmus obliquus]|uniref:Sulfatase N-terminal domain-containing protein n=1 Tax=Tetradesmus obliquus TaxID=3088 RepID=A0ABY8U4C6_TETOB|nr:hypothetical protein OEZ85_012998 [Tetradesmus obliquus]